MAGLIRQLALILARLLTEGAWGMHRYLSGTIVIIILTVMAVMAPFASAEAAYSIGFKSDIIEIISPSKNGSQVGGVLEIEGRASVARVWIALRGPNGDTETVPFDVIDGAFAGEIRLRFGAGKYTVWAGDNAYRFDGKIRFEVQNRTDQEVRYIAPSHYIDSDHPAILALARSLTGKLTDDVEKAKAIHRWVTGNISYDYAAYLNGGGQEIMKASEVLEAREGLCRDYAILTAALARAAGIPARVVYGQAGSNPGWDDQYHAWNEFLIDGKWVSLDTTWDAGYIKNGNFVRAQSDKYFIPAASEFGKTHTVTKYTVY